MKAFLLTVAIVVACTGSMFAQNVTSVYNWEVGVNGGFCGFTRPLGVADQYGGNRSNLVHDYSIKATYYFNEHWSLSFDLGTRQWKTFGAWSPEYTMGQTLKSRDVTFLVADHAISESFQMNYIIPFYTRYGDFNRANLYFGVLLGLINTTNDGSMGYSRYNAAPDSNMLYTSSYNYGAGMGYSYGLQVGYTYYVFSRLGINVELGMRYVNVHTHDERYASENNHFNLLYFPETIGLRWRF